MVKCFLFIVSQLVFIEPGGAASSSFAGWVRSQSVVVHSSALSVNRISRKRESVLVSILGLTLSVVRSCNSARLCLLPQSGLTVQWSLAVMRHVTGVTAAEQGDTTGLSITRHHCRQIQFVPNSDLYSAAALPCCPNCRGT